VVEIERKRRLQNRIKPLLQSGGNRKIGGRKWVKDGKFLRNQNASWERKRPREGEREDTGGCSRRLKINREKARRKGRGPREQALEKIEEKELFEE